MNELVRDLAPRYVPAKFDRNRRRIAPEKVLTGLCLQTDRRTISFQYTPLSTSLSGGIIMPLNPPRTTHMCTTHTHDPMLVHMHMSISADAPAMRFRYGVFSRSESDLFSTFSNAALYEISCYKWLCCSEINRHLSHFEEIPYTMSWCS